MTEVTDCQTRRGTLEGVPPLLEAFEFQTILCIFVLDETLESAIMFFIKPPVFSMLQMMAVHFVSDGVVGPDGSLQHGGVDQIKVKAIIFQDCAGFARFLHSVCCQWHILPPGETV